jgi:Family of unknown function (DUF6055)
LVLAAVVAVSVAASPATADPASGGPASRAAVATAVPAGEAREALAQAVRLVEGRRQGHVSTALMRLVRVYDALPPADRERADRLLARPTDRPDPEGFTYTKPEAPQSPACTVNFCAHWVASGPDAPSPADGNGLADGDGIPDYVENVLLIAEQTAAVENGKLKWRSPKSDGRRGGGRGKTDIYLVQLRGRLFGYAAPDRNQQRRGRLPRSLHGYLVLDDDYRAAEFRGAVPIESLQVTAAHEYGHILQFTYDAFQDIWMAESTATWMEEQVFDSINDYLRYVRRWVSRTEIPLTGGAAKVYGSAVWNLWLQRRYGAGVIRSAWARAKRSRPGGFSVRVYARAIAAAGRSTFNRDFASFSADVAEWRTGDVFAEGASYRDVERRGQLSLGGAVLRRSLDHATFALIRVRRAAGKALRVRARAPRGVIAGLALVGRIGGETSGTVVSDRDFSKRGGKLAVTLRRPGRFQRITAVLINASARQRGFNPFRNDWFYRDDNARFAASARLIR